MQEQAQQRAKLHRFKGHFQIGQHIRRDVGCACDDARRACDHALGHIKDCHDDIERVGQDQDGTSGFEYPFVDIRHVELVHIVLFQYHLDQLIGGNKGQDQSGNRQYHRFGKLPYQGEHPGVPCRRGSPHLYGYFPDAGIHRVKQPLEVSHDALDQKPFEPFRDPFGENTHRQLPLKQGRQQRDQGRAQHDDAAARHELFYPQLGVKLCSMAGGGVQKIYMVFLREPSRRDRSGSDLFHLRDGFEIKMNFDRNVSCFIFVNALMHDDFFD